MDRDPGLAPPVTGVLETSLYVADVDRALAALDELLDEPLRGAGGRGG